MVMMRGLIKKNKYLEQDVSCWSPLSADKKWEIIKEAAKLHAFVVQQGFFILMRIAHLLCIIVYSSFDFQNVTGLLCGVLVL